MRRVTLERTDSAISVSEQRIENHSMSSTPLSNDDLVSTLTPATSLRKLEFPQPNFQPGDNGFHVNELLMFHDAAFVKTAYQAILQREPDPYGYNYYLTHLRQGFLNKIDVIAGIRFSPEGRRKGVHVRGLAVPNLVRRIRSLPVVGYLFGLGLDVLRLPVLIHRIQTQQAHSLFQDQEIAEHINLTNQSVDRYLSTVSAALAKISTELTETSHASATLGERQEQENQRTKDLIHQFQLQAERNISELRKLKEAASHDNDEIRRSIEDLSNSSHQLNASLSQIQSSTEVNQQQTDDIERRLQRVRSDLTGQARETRQLLEEARRRLPEPFDKQQLQAIADHEPHRLDGLYAELEDRFRGSQEQIKQRLAIYVERIKSAATAGNFSLVDLGCGRGEWLELLQDEGLKAFGVDTNRVFLESCRERNLEVVECDAVQYLSGLPPQSVAAITGFHIVEHLPMDGLINLLDEVVRVLRPGGIVIFETPNPENVLVGSNFFYFDPTHRNPIPGSLMKFLLEARGLHQVEIIGLNPWDDARLSGDNELTARINELFYGPMDYAVVGWKVSE
jgi:O-antigen chain-terminating methyltransferase